MSNSKQSWPELEGKEGEEAKAIIEKEMLGIGAIVVVIPEDAVVTMDFRTDRVRIYVNTVGKVSVTPRVG